MKATVHIEKLVHRGYGLGRLPGGKVVLVPYTAPGEEADIRVVLDKRSLAFGELLEVRRPSPARRPAPCPYFGRCGGCQLMHLDYACQLECKRRIAGELLRREVLPGVPGGLELGYRRRVRLHVTPDGSGLGFMHQYTNKIVEIQDCLLCHDSIRRIFPWLIEWLLPEATRGGARLREIELVAGDSAGPALRLHPAAPLLPILAKRLQAACPVPLSVAGPGEEWTTLEMALGPYRYAVAAGSFFQANPAAVAEVFRSGRLALPPESRLLELYAGMGLFTVHFAASAAAVLAVERDARAVRLFRENLGLNQVDNVELVEAEVEDWLRRSFARGRFEAVFVDPPRTGLSPAVRRSLGEAGFRQLLYLSCDPATQARDLAEILSRDRHRPVMVTFFDFFPNTFHLETLACVHGSD